MGILRTLRFVMGSPLNTQGNWNLAHVVNAAVENVDNGLDTHFDQARIQKSARMSDMLEGFDG